MEIERKWLISPEKIPYRLEELPALAIEQAYISFNPVVRVRKINEGERYILTIKRPTEHGGIAAAEAEHEIDRETYEFLLGHAAGTVITKTRYLHTLPAGLTEEIDVFSGALKGRQKQIVDLAHRKKQRVDQEVPARIPQNRRIAMEPSGK